MDAGDELKQATAELAEKIKEEIGVVGDTTGSEDQTEDKEDLLDDNYGQYSEEDISDEDNDMNDDEDVEMQ